MSEKGSSNRTCCPIFCNIAEVDALWEGRCVIVDILKVHLNVSVTDQSFSAFILSKHGKAPLRPSIRLIPVQWLQKKRERVTEDER